MVFPCQTAKRTHLVSMGFRAWEVFLFAIHRGVADRRRVDAESPDPHDMGVPHRSPSQLVENS